MRRRGNETTLPELERMLTTAAAGQVKESSRRIGRIRPSRIVAIGAACLAFTGTAVAATGVWNPIVGSSDNPATLSNTPVPAELIAELGVLRGEQTAQDRSAEVEATLNGGVALPAGVRLDSVRYLAPAANGEATILLSGVDTSPIFTENEPLCVARPFVGVQEALSFCFDLSMLMSGDARTTMVDETSGSSLAFGLVPDGVTTVTAKFGSAPDVTVPVANNYFELPLSGSELSNANGEAGVQSTVWRDADGNVVGGGDGNT